MFKMARLTFFLAFEILLSAPPPPSLPPSRLLSGSIERSCWEVKLGEKSARNKGSSSAVGMQAAWTVKWAQILVFLSCSFFVSGFQIFYDSLPSAKFSRSHILRIPRSSPLSAVLQSVLCRRMWASHSHITFFDRYPNAYRIFFL